MSGPVRGRLGDSLAAFRAVFTNRSLRLLELAWAASETGKWFYTVALAVYAYDIGGATAVGIVALIRIVPAAVLAPTTAVLADRYRREVVMLIATLLRTAAFAAAAVAVALDLPSGIVYALAGLVGVLSTTFRPAQSALIPTLARTPEELTAANVVTSTIASVGSFAGPALGGLLLAVTNVETVFAVTAGSFLVPALLIARLGSQPRPERRQAEAPGLGSELMAGFRTIVSRGELRVLVGLYAAQTLVAGALVNVLIVVVALELLETGNGGVGYLISAFGVGGVVGTLLTVVLVARQRLATDFALGMFLWGLPLIVLAVWVHPAVAFLMLTLVGVGDVIIEVAAPTLLQRAVPDEVLARVFGAVESVIIGAMGVGAILAPPLVDWLGARGAMIATGCVLPVLAVLFWRRLAAIDRAAPVPARQLELLRDIPIFAPLPEPMIERLAGHLVPLAVPAGADVFRQGEPGDRFYVIDEGEVEVSVDGAAVRTEMPGDYFGEIALLRDVPRTAGVAATADTRLYALDRDEFLSAVSGHAASQEAADAVISTRLSAGAARLMPE